MPIYFLLFILCGFFTLPALSDPQTPPSTIKLCSACHEDRGQSSEPKWPRLAGQNSAYLRKQLLDFQNKEKRYDPIMSPISLSLSKKDIEELADFYSKQPIKNSSLSKKISSSGARLYHNGDAFKRIPACIICHGPKALGNARTGFPALQGMPTEYIIQQLQQFKNKSRRNDLNKIMQVISSKMSDEDINEIALYLSKPFTE